MSNMKDMSIDALNKGVDENEEAFKMKAMKADKSTESHGVEGKAPISESVRHKRIQSNFYGTTVNFMACILAELGNISDKIDKIEKGEKKE